MQLFNRSPKHNGRSGAHTPSAIQFLLAQPKTKARSNGGGSVIAFTSANAGRGGTHVGAKAKSFTTLGPNDLIDLRGKCARTNVDQLWMLRKSANGNGQKPAAPSVSDAAGGLA